MNDPERPGRRRQFRFPWRTRHQVAQDLEAELAFHIDARAADLQAEGWSGADARAEAVRRFGDLDYTRAYCRREDARREQEKRHMTILDELRQDLAFTFRSMRSSRGFTAAALLTLALGIGANTAVFSVVQGVLLDPLPFRDADQLVRVWHARPSSGTVRGTVSEPDFLDWREAARTAASMGAYFFADGLSGLDLTGAGDPERLSAALVTDGFFQTLGTTPRLGRALTPDEHVAGGNRVVVLSHGFWTRRFGADPAIVGRAITLDGEPFEVVGVMPPGFTYPATQTLDVWIPLSYFGPEQIGRGRGVHFLSVVARLNTGVTPSQLHAEIGGIAARLSREHLDNAGWDDVTVAPVRDTIVGDVRRPLFVLSASVGLLLLIACVNIASLLLARASGRQRELAVRAALGAGRGRIARQLLTESLTLAVIGGALGVVLGQAGVNALVRSGNDMLPWAADIRLDASVLTMALVASLAVGLAFGLVPTLRATRDLDPTLRAGARGAGGGSGQGFRSALVVCEVALAVMLVIAAGLVTKSFARLSAVDLGFRPQNALVATFSIGSGHQGEERLAYLESVLDAVRAVPGVQAAGTIRDLPLLGNGEGNRPRVPGRSDALGEPPAVQIHHVSADFFKAIGTPLVSGRSVSLSDRVGTPWVTVVNEEAARRLWPGEDAVGKTLLLGSTEVRVVGVVGDIRQRGIAEPVDPAMYLHLHQNFRNRISLVVRVTGDPATYAGLVRQAIWSNDKQQTITGVTTLDDVLGRVTARPRLLAWLLSVFGAIGLSLGVLGIFGVLAYAVNQRRQEIGVRVALGASAHSVVRLIVGRGMLLAGAGLALGLGGAAILAGSMRAVLFDIEPLDAWTFAQVSVVLLGAALLASWFPARRALAIDPVSALRYD